VVKQRDKGCVAAGEVFGVLRETGLCLSASAASAVIETA
jgi:hypothetical protein